MTGRGGPEKPTQLWDHNNGLTSYQIWTGYRVATRQLKLYHAARRESNSCRKTPACNVMDETIVHLFWECVCIHLLVTGPGKQSLVNRSVPCSRPVPVDEFTVKSSIEQKNLNEMIS